MTSVRYMKQWFSVKYVLHVIGRGERGFAPRIVLLILLLSIIKVQDIASGDTHLQWITPTPLSFLASTYSAISP